MTKDKYIGCMLGCGIGDTIGMAVEGWKKEQIAKYVGKLIHIAKQLYQLGGAS